MGNLIILIGIIIIALIFIVNILIEKDSKYMNYYIFIAIAIAGFSIFSLSVAQSLPSIRGSFKSEYNKCREKYYIESKRKEVTIDGREIFYIKFRTGSEIETTENFYRIAEPEDYIKEIEKCDFI